METFLSYNLKDTENFAKKISGKLHHGDILLLYGDLGVGKTTFSQSIIKALGYNGRVNSPTFTFLNEYPTEIPVYHFDMYRLESLDEAQEIGVEDIFKSGHGVCLVEWPEKISPLLPKDAIIIKIEYVDTNTRRFIVKKL